MPIINNTTQVLRDQAMIAGIKKHSSTVTSWVIAGTTYTSQQAVDILQARVDAALKVPTAKAAYSNTVKAARTETAQSKQFVAAIRQAVYIMFSAAVDTLADFGIAPHKVRTPPTPVQKVQAAARTKQTRALRHTSGKKAKANLKGAAIVTVTATSSLAEAPAQLATPAAGPHGPSTQGS